MANGGLRIAATLTAGAFFGLGMPAPVTAQDQMPVNGFLANGRAVSLEVRPSIHPGLADHVEYVEKAVYRTGDHVYSAVGWSRVNTIMIEGETGVIIIDPGPSPRTARGAAFELKKHTEKPVKAVIYTHSDPDHWGGTQAFVNKIDMTEGNVEIYAHSSIIDDLVRQTGSLGPVLAVREAYASGVVLVSAEKDGITAGLGRVSGSEPGQMVSPTKVIESAVDLEIAGINILVMPYRSGGAEHLALYLPDSKTLLPGTLLQGPARAAGGGLDFGAAPDVPAWLEEMDALAALGAENLVPIHGQPVFGREKVAKTLQVTRDAVQYLHDQTVRFMNQGLGPDELVQKIDLPTHLSGYAVHMRGLQGVVPDLIRQIYHGYMGWYTGDPVDLDPLPREEESKRTVELMGGWRSVLRAAREAYSENEYQWTAELTSHLIRVRPRDRSARRLKAAALRKMGYASRSITHRNWYLSTANELEGTVDAVGALRQVQMPLLSGGVVSLWPSCSMVENLSTRLRAEVTGEVHMMVGFEFSDVDETCALEIRHGVAQYHKTLPERTDFTVTVTREILFGLLRGRMSVSDGLASGQLMVSAGTDTLRDFLGLFDSPAPEVRFSKR